MASKGLQRVLEAFGGLPNTDSAHALQCMLSALASSALSRPGVVDICLAEL